MRLIDADKCFDAIVDLAADEESTSIALGACKAAEIVASCPTVNAVSVTSCKNCKHGTESAYGIACVVTGSLKNPDGFCDDGEPKGNDVMESKETKSYLGFQ